MLKPTHVQRLLGARRAVRDARIDAMLICPSQDFLYLTGYMPHKSERMLTLVVTPSKVALLCPQLEADAAALALKGIPVWRWSDGEDAVDVLRERLGRSRRLAVNAVMRADWVVRLAESLPEPRIRSAAPLLDSLRASKDAGEIRRLAAAAAQADRVMGFARGQLKAGVTEESVALKIMKKFRALGAVNPWALVASGENGGMPHHSYGPRKLRRGDVIIVDLGAELDGYQSDITRTFFLGEPSPEARRVYDIVLGAQSAGRAAVMAGASGRSADRAAREFITRHGYGKFFMHRLGHGLGMDIHEAPYLSADNRAPLPAGAVVTVEPGIYMPGKFGVRLEDVVVAQPRGARTLTSFPLDRALLR